MNPSQNTARNAFPDTFGTGQEQGSERFSCAGAREPLHSTEQPTPSRSDAQTARATETTDLARLAAIDERDALAKIVLSLRPDWSVRAILGWLRTDDRPWTDIARAALRADDRDIRTPTGLRYVGAEYDGAPTPTPMRFDEWQQRDKNRCPNGAIHDPHPCALCRAGITPDPHGGSL